MAADFIDRRLGSTPGQLGRFRPEDVANVIRLYGGAANEVWLVTLAAGGRVVVKVVAGPPEICLAEAEGLDAIRATGVVRTPSVLDVGADFLVLEAFEAPAPDCPVFWERAGRAAAALHGIAGERFGWERDGWLGRLPQHNAWSDSGHAFFAERRLLRYLDEPLVRQALDADVRTGIERICARLPELVPAMPPVFTHGDLWHGNVVVTTDGEPVFIDPAVCWMWAEADLSMMWCTGSVPKRFFDAYRESHPLQAGWQRRMRLLNMRELLSSVAHMGARYQRIDEIRAIVRAYR
jgi:fructosamine-3-kinase